jgi:DNA repair protein RecO (recombination protein O)
VVAVAPYSESSQVARLLTADLGFVAVLARGAHRDKSAFGGPLDVLTVGRADLTERRGSDLALLHGLRVTKPLRGLRSALPRWLGAAAVIELLLPFALPRERARDLFDLAIATLDALDGAADPAAAQTCLAYFLARLLALAGFRPRIDACARCQTPSPPPPLRFSPRLGGLICGKCAQQAGREASAVKVDPATLAMLERLLGESSSRVASSQALRAAWQLLEEFAEERLERPLRAGRWLASGIPAVKPRS